MVPLSEFGIVENPVVRVPQKAALRDLDAPLVVAGICRSQVSETVPVLGVAEMCQICESVEQASGREADGVGSSASLSASSSSSAFLLSKSSRILINRSPII